MTTQPSDLISVFCFSEALYHKRKVYPLGNFSRFIAFDLPSLRAVGNLSSMVRAAERSFDLLQISDLIESESEYTLGVALGDIGALCTALVQLQTDSNQMDRYLDAASRIGRVIGLPPRDGYYTYTTLNFPHVGARAYSTHVQEYRYICLNFCQAHLFRKALRGLIMCVNSSFEESELNLRNILITKLSLEQAQKAMLLTRNTVSPRIIEAKRGCDSDLTVDGAVWERQSGFHDGVIFMLDLLLYGWDAQLETQFTRYAPYFPHYIRQSITVFTEDGLEPLFTRLISMVNSSHRSQVLADLCIGVLGAFYRWRVIHNSAISTHLRRFNRGQISPGQYHYDESITELINRAEKHWKLANRIF